MVYIHPLFGLALIAMGSLIALQGNVPNNILPRLALRLLALFGFAHGIHEWLDILTIVPGLPVSVLMPLDRIEFALITVSFAFLASAGVELLIGIREWPKRARILSVAVIPLVTTTVFLSVDLNSHSSQTIGQTVGIGKPLARYLIAFPGALLTGYALWKASNLTFEPVRRSCSFCLRAAAVAFFFYAIFSGLIPENSYSLPSSWLTADSFFATTGVPVVLFRAACAIAISIFLSQAFTIELANRLAYQQLREEYLSHVAHDLRTPLTVILSTAQLLERSAESKPDRVRFWSSNIQTNARNLNRMIEDLLDTSLIESKRLVLQKSPADLCRLVRHVAERIKPAYPKSEIQVRIPEGEVIVNMDPQRIEQALVNLISNAVKYSSPRTPITVEAGVESGEVVVSVTNQGIEISEEDRPYLFERYYRGEKRKKKGSGLGLGLYIVKGLIEAHEGRIWLEPNDEKLTIFRFALPLSIAW